MIRIQYDDSIINNQLYCSLQIQREMNCGEYSFLFMSRWFGSAEILPAAARGELLALAAVLGNYKHELILISPDLSNCVEKVLVEWRTKFNRVEYGNPDLSIEKLLNIESSLLADSDERAVVDEIMVKNLPPSVFYDQNVVNKTHVPDECFDYEKHVLALIEPPSKIIGFRKVFSKKHFKEIISQANDHNLLLYYSSFTIQGKHVVAEGPWILLPATLRNFKRSVDTIVDVEDLVGVGEDNQLSDNVSTNNKLSAIVNQRTGSDTVTKKVDEEIMSEIEKEIDNVSEIVEDPDEGFACPYCEKKMKKAFGVTNHVNQKHPEKLDEYNATKQG